jgi:hypothetical protein
MIYDSERMKAVRLAQEELRRWERRYDRHRGADPLRYIAEIKQAEQRYLKAVETLRLVRDGRPRLSDTSGVATAPRAPTFHRQ